MEDLLGDSRSILKSIIDDTDAILFEQIPKPKDSQSKFIKFNDVIE